MSIERFRATVINSLSEANKADFINAEELNFPVPVNSLEEKVLSAICNLSFIIKVTFIKGLSFF
ncbi:hypothetical protein JCM19274_2457 [Algibacter lectus]|uniref:Uncharacterized protein n=1 Tax=Algibacter lectus TaxID=221126 RepID=A0A090WWM3_9FLAO|nr:hypothetical protein JCM19274_2457 [Algibacter lectus]